MFVHYLVGSEDDFWFTLRVKQLIAEDGRDAIAVEVQTPPNYTTYGVRIATP